MRRYAACLATLFVVMAPVAASAQESSVRYPSVSGDNLNEKSFQLPQDFAGNPSIVIHGFVREHQELIDPWLSLLADLQAAYPDMEYYELPTIDRMNALMRWWIDRGMRSGIPGEAQRARVITLYLQDKQAFMDALNMREDTVYVLFVDTNGQVFATIEGALSDDKAAQLMRILRDRHKKQPSE